MVRKRVRFGGETLNGCVDFVPYLGWGRQNHSFPQAMKRIGFLVCQTAGSSVRFDPPAKTARPITFHRVRIQNILLSSFD